MQTTFVRKKSAAHNIMYKKLPVHRLFKGYFPQQVHCTLIGNRSAFGNFPYMQRYAT